MLHQTYLHGPLLEDGGRVLSPEADAGGKRSARGSRREVIVNGIVVVGTRGGGCACPVDDVVVVGRVSETEVEELVPRQSSGPNLPTKREG